MTFCCTCVTFISHRERDKCVGNDMEWMLEPQRVQGVKQWLVMDVRVCVWCWNCLKCFSNQGATGFNDVVGLPFQTDHYHIKGCLHSSGNARILSYLPPPLSALC